MNCFELSSDKRQTSLGSSIFRSPLDRRLIRNARSEITSRSTISTNLDDLVEIIHAEADAQQRAAVDFGNLRNALEKVQHCMLRARLAGRQAGKASVQSESRRARNG